MRPVQRHRMKGACGQRILFTRLSGYGLLQEIDSPYNVYSATRQKIFILAKLLVKEIITRTKRNMKETGFL